MDNHCGEECRRPGQSNTHLELLCLLTCQAKVVDVLTIEEVAAQGICVLGIMITYSSSFLLLWVDCWQICWLSSRPLLSQLVLYA